MNAIMINYSYYIKQVIFEGDNDNVVELISITQEGFETNGGNTLFIPTIIASNIRELTKAEAESFGLSLLDEDIKIEITEEQANKLAGLVDKEDEIGFLAEIKELIK